MSVKEIAKNVHWVGQVDWSIRDFHSFNTDEGATYNAFLLLGGKAALIDGVKAEYAPGLVARVSRLLAGKPLEFVVCNHAEPDHSGSLPQVMAAFPAATLLCTKKCKEILGRLYRIEAWKIQTVGSSDTIALGEQTLQFVETPMLHWPDSMFTYCREARILFSMDAFGQHYASSRRLDEEVPLHDALQAAKSYYANIIMPLGNAVAQALKKTSVLDIGLIAPSHGVLWSRHIPEIMSAYRQWSECRPQPKALVLFDSMWHATERMAEAIVEGASQPELEVKLIAVRASNLTQIATEMLDAAAFAFGSATQNNSMLPAAAAVLTYLKGLRPANKAAFSFGTCGWGRGGPEGVEEYLKGMNCRMLREPLKAIFAPDEENLKECVAAGGLLADAVRERVASTPSSTAP